MAWVATDNFEGASVGDWDGVSTGSGFSGNWTLISGADANFQIDSTPVAEGTRAAYGKAATNGTYIERALTTSFTDGSMYFLIRRNSTSGSVGMRTRMPAAGGAVEYDVGFSGSSILMYGAGGTTTVASGLSANTWYEVNIEFDTTVPRHRVRVRPQLGTWGAFSAYDGPNGGNTAGAITALGWQVLGSDNTICYIDRISPTEEPSASGPANLKSLNTNVKANIKSYNTNALANIKSINTNA